MTSNADSKILGIVVLARHGDRQGFYQDPETYDASATSITPLGETQEFQLGDLLRSLYLNASSPTYIQGISPSTSLFDQTQVAVRADAGGERGVIFDSAVALLQGLWPVTPRANTTLANGTTVTSPLGGYQYVPIESVEPDEDVSLEGFTECTNFINRNEAFYQSPAFLEKSNQSAAFLAGLQPFLDGRPVTLENMWNIYDYMNVQSIHNASFAQSLPPTFLAQARDLANWHEYNIFSDPALTGIGNIAARTMLPSVINAFQRIVNVSDPLKLHYSSIAYKPFLSFFNITGVVQDGQLPPSIVNYAASVVFEVRQSTTDSEPVIRFNFKNGSDDAAFRTYNMAIPGSTSPSGGDVPVSAFISAFQPAAVNSTTDWCNVCAQSMQRGCAALLAGGQHSQSLNTGAHDKVSPVGAGFIGAGATFVVMSALLGALVMLGVVSGGRRWKNSKHVKSQMSGDENSENTSITKH